MPNIQQVLKEEIARVARKEIKVATDKLNQDNTALKKSVSSLKKQVASLERETAKLSKATGKATADQPKADEDSEEKRFWISGKGVRRLRAKLGLTQVELAKLVGVSGQAVYQWESTDETLKLRSKAVEGIKKAREISGVKEARKVLEELV
jgi:DNA-binding XRE family transcriptional regulator